MSDALIDREAWEALKSMTDPAFLIELIDMYLTDSPELIEQMKTGLANGDIESVRRAAHSIKSNSLTFGANRLGNTARELEMIAKAGTLEGADIKLASLEMEYALLEPLLVELKNEC